MEGIILFLTKYGGNVQENRIVRLSSRSDRGDSLPNLVELSDDSVLLSKSMADQWVCWDFGDLRIEANGCTIWEEIT
jgi:hypothetical protein